MEAPEIGVTKTLLVTGDMMIGEIIVKLATTFGKGSGESLVPTRFNVSLALR